MKKGMEQNPFRSEDVIGNFFVMILAALCRRRVKRNIGSFQPF